MSPFWERFGMEDWRGVIAVGLLVLTGTLALTGYEQLASTVFAGFMAIAATYFYSKGE